MHKCSAGVHVSNCINPLNTEYFSSYSFILNWNLQSKFTAQVECKCVEIPMNETGWRMWMKFIMSIIC